MRGYIIRYIIGGGVVFLFNIGLFHFLAETMNLWYLYASTISFLATLVASFLVQKYWTFQDRSTERLPYQVTSFAALGGINLVLNTICMSVLAGGLSVPNTAAQVVTTSLVVSWSFFAYRYLFTITPRHHAVD